MNISRSTMHLSSTKLVFPWTLGQISNNSDHSGVFQTYQWIPGPFVTTMIIIVMLVFTLMPAVCSVCYHVYYWASNKDADPAVRFKDLYVYRPPAKRINASLVFRDITSGINCIMCKELHQ